MFNIMIRTLCFFILSCFVLSFSATAADLIITLSPVKNDTGSIRVDLWDSIVGFNEKKLQYRKKVLKLNADNYDKERTIVFSGLKQGTYVVRAYHDENESGKHEKPFFGKSEYYGYSNNPPSLLFWNHTFNQVAIEIGDESVFLTIHITQQ